MFGGRGCCRKVAPCSVLGGGDALGPVVDGHSATTLRTAGVAGSDPLGVGRIRASTGFEPLGDGIHDARSISDCEIRLFWGDGGRRVIGVVAPVEERAKQPACIVLHAVLSHDDLDEARHDAGVLRPGLAAREQRRLGCVERAVVGPRDGLGREASGGERPRRFQFLARSPDELMVHRMLIASALALINVGESGC